MDKKRLASGIMCSLIVAAVLFGLAYYRLSKKPVEGAKHLTIEIIHVDETAKIMEIDTDEEFLRGALDQEGLIAGEDGAFGFWITAVDGYTADQSKEEWWGLTKNGEYVETGVDATVIEDGDKFEIRLNTGYDGF